MKHPIHAHILQHVPFEGPGRIADWVIAQGGALSWTHLYAGDPLPKDLKGIDLLVIMGGPMGVHDTAQYSWLQSEIDFVRNALHNPQVKVLGVCLGAQIMAYALGAEVFRNAHREIGWYPVQLSAELQNSSTGVAQKLAQEWTDPFMAFHWHGETFTIPEKAVAIGSSAACQNQGFVWNNRAIGLQFHLESQPQSVDALLLNCPEDLVNGGIWVGSADQIRQNTLQFHGQSGLDLEICLGALTGQ